MGKDIARLRVHKDFKLFLNSVKRTKSLRSDKDASKFLVDILIKKRGKKII